MLPDQKEQPIDIHHAPPSYARRKRREGISRSNDDLGLVLSNKLTIPGLSLAALDVSSAAEEKYRIESDRPCQPTDKATTRGAIFHERRSGESATVFLDDGHVLLRISCLSAAGDLEENVPYRPSGQF